MRPGQRVHHQRREVGAPATWVVSAIHDISVSDTYKRIPAGGHSLKTAAVIKADAQLRLDIKMGGGHQCN